MSVCPYVRMSVFRPAEHQCAVRSTHFVFVPDLPLKVYLLSTRLGALLKEVSKYSWLHLLSPLKAGAIGVWKCKLSLFRRGYDKKTNQPINRPTNQPTFRPTDRPTNQPNDRSTMQPTDQPTKDGHKGL